MNLEPYKIQTSNTMQHPTAKPLNTLFSNLYTYWKPYPVPNNPVEPYYSTHMHLSHPPRCLTHQKQQSITPNHKKTYTAVQKRIKKGLQGTFLMCAAVSKSFHTRLAVRAFQRHQEQGSFSNFENKMLSWSKSFWTM